MTRIFTIIFSVLTLITVILTYFDVGMQKVDVKTLSATSVRSGSYGVSYYGSGGGYRYGK